MLKKFIHFNLFIVGTLFFHSACIAVPAVLRYDIDGVLELSKAAAQRTFGHESVVSLETESEVAATGFLVDPWTVVTAGHIPVNRSTKVVLGSVDSDYEGIMVTDGSADPRIKEDEGRAALYLETVTCAYSTAEPISYLKTVREVDADNPIGISLLSPDKHWHLKFEEISAGRCHRWEPFVKGRHHQDLQIFKLERPLAPSTFLKHSKRLPFGFQEWDTTIVGYPRSVIAKGQETVFINELTQIALKNRFFYCHNANAFFTPFSGYDQEHPRSFNIWPSYMDPLAGVTGSGMGGSPVIDNITNRVIGVVSGRIRQDQDEAEGISFSLVQPLAPYYDKIKASLGRPY